MKDIVIYINEVSKGLAQRAYNKATGAQKNRIKKLYKEIYGTDVNKSDISKIKFNIDDIHRKNDVRILDNFKLWDQDLLDNIKKIEGNIDKEEYYYDNSKIFELTITFNDDSEKNYWANWEYKDNHDFDSDYKLRKTNINGLNNSYYAEWESFIGMIYKNLKDEA